MSMQWTRQRALAGALLAAAALLMSSGCVNTYRTIQDAQAAPTGEHVALETSDVRTTSIPLIYEKTDYLGYRFWTCKRAQGKELECVRLCDGGGTGLECATERRGLFGKISRAQNEETR